MLSKTNVDSKQWFVCFENTGVYSTEFLIWLIGENIACLEENAIQISRSMGLKRGKDDKSDSKAICRYAYEKRHLLKPTSAKGEFIKAKEHYFTAKVVRQTKNST